TPFIAASSDDALKMVLQERRKELLMRNRRFNDLRRLNKDSRFAITLKRILGANTHELPPNDKRYVFPIPETVIAATGMAQNER
ncbi:MAG: RagB/SusD family nutrient uptake outer membrane protein, partial [Daejeonella sp.]